MPVLGYPSVINDVLYENKTFDYFSTLHPLRCFLRQSRVIGNNQFSALLLWSLS